MSDLTELQKEENAYLSCWIWMCDALRLSTKLRKNLEAMVHTKVDISLVHTTCPKCGRSGIDTPEKNLNKDLTHEN